MRKMMIKEMMRKGNDMEREWYRKGMIQKENDEAGSVLNDKEDADDEEEDDDEQQEDDDEQEDDNKRRGTILRTEKMMMKREMLIRRKIMIKIMKQKLMKNTKRR